MTGGLRARKMASGSVLLAVGLVLAACSSTPSGTPSSKVDTTTSAPSSTSSSSSSSSSSSTPSTSTTTATTSAACSTGVLQPSTGGTQTSAGTTHLTFVLTNSGPSACSLTGYPTLALFGASGAGGAGAGPKLAISDVQEPGSAKAVELAPKGTASFVLSVSEVPVNGAGCSTVASLQITPPGASDSLSLPDSFQACGSSVGVYPLTAGS
ncbi:MAG: hypothetical protein JWM85_916 [Acidimicrobiaceae bacterium]|nr:hypothetical protein [Acidimicrobiaceae bacterium]